LKYVGNSKYTDLSLALFESDDFEWFLSGAISMSKYSELQIIEIEERLRQAMLNSDVAELESLIAPELIFTSYLGQLVSKQQDLALHQSGMLKFSALMPSEQYIQCNEGFSVVSVKMHILGSFEEAKIDQHYRFTRVWSVSSTGSLQVIAGHVSIVSS
jgi:hypothetical protein